MIAALYAGAEPPGWVGVLIAAEKWGCTPWEIAGGSKLVWYARFSFWQSQLAKAQHG